MRNFIFFCLLTSLYAPGTYAVSLPPWLRKGLTHTFHPGNAYSEYYTWLAPLRGRIELAFKTSKQNATLIYIAGNDQLVHVALQNGRIASSAIYRFSSTLMQGTGTGVFNDDQWHHLTLVHDYQDITVEIDKKMQTELSDDHSYLTTGVTPLYIGGIPLSVKPSPSFQGCIKDVFVGNNSLDTSLAYYEVPVFQNMTSPGCIEPCQNQTCSEGEICTNDWSNGVGMCSCTAKNETCLQSKKFNHFKIVMLHCIVFL